MNDTMDQKTEMKHLGDEFRSHSSHWGAFRARWDGERLQVTPRADDPDPSSLLQNIPDALRHKARIARPAIRKGWLEGKGAGSRRSGNDFIEMPWDEVLDLLAEKLRSTRDEHGPESIFGGSYGWASAGRFHHAQSQVHRFLNTAMGGYVRSVNNYSAGAALVVLPYVFGPYADVTMRNVTWEQVEAHTDIVLAFGGLPTKNTSVASGGISSHIERPSMVAAHRQGTRFVSVSPMRDDMIDEVEADWFASRPSTDVAFMMALAHVLVSEGLHDRGFLDQYTSGYDRFEAYLMGRIDGVAKTPEWAAEITGIDANRIRALALDLPKKRVLIVTAQSLQRARYGEQPIWMAATLAAMLGQIGLPGGGFNYALGSLAHYGRQQGSATLPALPQGQNGVETFIPVARIADMLLNPGAGYDYNGQKLTYPKIELIYWLGGNPFHHHQDINRLKAAFDQVETLVVHESVWTPMARYADVVLPATITLERNDLACGRSDPTMIAMQQVAPPFAQARDDFSIFAALSRRLDVEQAFTEGRSADEWVRHFYENTRRQLLERGEDAPDFDSFWSKGEVALPQDPDDGGILRAFRQDPQGSPLPTETGKIVVFSETIASFGYDDCPGHPVWLEPTEVPMTPDMFYLVANQPARRLHSQLDFGAHSVAGKTSQRETLRMHPEDAERLGVGDGDIVKISNRRGACLAGVALTDAILQGVVNLPTGAWYDPECPNGEAPLCVHGNPNVLTKDIGTSRLSQGCTGQITFVFIERFDGPLPPVRAYDPPACLAARNTMEGQCS
ncbi:molybdopterin guanine dinucleotide-containing S/N-oxide reductase [Rhodobacteraceae bacterium D3-12]|nr:molybdopterin guanine dinucleotide-containing S/N-oxide reductase [Rhodobacteraceae bacterium D3-12]